MLASQVIERYQAFCPPSLAMEGDVKGLQIGTLNKEIQRVMVALDIRETTVAEAIDKKVDLIIVKHAPIFRPIKDLVADNPQTKMYLDLIKHDIAVYVSHTDIDVVEGGLNDWFCELLEIQDTSYLIETAEGQGLGRVGTIAEQTLEELALKVKSVFGLDAVRLVTYGHQAQQYVNRVAICGGSGGSYYHEALAKGADVYITGDIYYHTGQDMLTQGLLAIDPGHHIEALFIKKIAVLLETWKAEEGWDVEILPSTVSTNPFRHL
ncbi:TPA: Nif3-like dinuclear metal center hexameric protein [Streptococcus suis]|nr:Nif3-like dinuclear metal center hexameric protein [Streptococcus suis]HEM4250535.1 Nif3-like dinuclear metal center hexameric protein [Streptococcus suis]